MWLPAFTLTVSVAATGASGIVVSAGVTAITLPTRLNLAWPCFQPPPGPPATASGTSVSARAATTTMRSSLFTPSTSFGLSGRDDAVRWSRILLTAQASDS